MRRFFLVMLMSVSLATVATAAELPTSAKGLLPADWSAVDEGAPTDAGPWWTALGGDELGTLLGRADADNPDRRSADERVTQSLARREQTTAALLPSVNLNGSATYAMQQQQAIPGIELDDTMWSGSATADATVPLTIYRDAPDRAAATDDWIAARHDATGTAARTSVQTARAWVELVYARERLGVIETQVQGDTDLYGLTEARYGSGESSGSDVLQQRQQLTSSQANLPDARAAVARAEWDLRQVLLWPAQDGLPVATLALPAPSAAPDLSTPARLAEVDPTVQATVADWHAATHRRTSARLALTPELSATASAGAQYSEMTEDPWSPTWSVGVRATVPVFNGGRVKGQIREADATERVAELAVQSAVAELVASTEADRATLQARAGEVAAREANEQAAADALQATTAEYERGLTSYNSVLNALSTAKTAQLNLVSAKRAHWLAWLDLVERSAGLWADDLPTAG